jgi:hypothetical protein
MEEGTLYVRPDEHAELVRVLPPPGAGSAYALERPGVSLRISGLPIVVDAEQAARQSEVAPRCLCVSIPSLEDQGAKVQGDRLCPVHGPDSPTARLTEARRRLAADIRADVEAQLRGDDGVPPASS